MRRASSTGARFPAGQAQELDDVAEPDELEDVLDVVLDDVPEPDVPELDVPEPEEVDAASDFLAVPSLEPLDEALDPEERESLR